MTRKAAIEMAQTWNKNLEPGASLEGKYLKREIYSGQYGEAKKYIIQDNGGTKWAVFASASLGNQFNNIPEGSYVWITFKGEETTKSGRPVKVYSVDYDDEYQG